MSEPVPLPVVAPPRWESIPASLAERRQWLLWRYEEKKGAKKPLKMPYWASGRRRVGTQGDTRDRASLVGLEEARAVYEAAPSRWAGVGFAFLPGDGLTGVDMDDHVDPDTGEISERCQNIVDACSSYTEFSPSGKGVHIIVGAETETNKSDDIGLEIFCGSQYFTFSGRHWSSTPSEVIDIDAGVLRRLHATVNEAKEAHKAKGKTPAPPPERPVQSKAFDGQRGTDFKRVNATAMANLAAWVPAVFPGAKEREGGYRISSKELGRQLQEDLSIHPKGIKDFGVHDLGDARDGARTPIDIVMEFVPGKAKPLDALKWLAGQIGITLDTPTRRRREPDANTPGQEEGGDKSSDPGGDVVEMEAKRPKRKRKKQDDEDEDDIDWGKFNYLVKNFVLIYGTDEVWDAVHRETMKISAMAHAHGSSMVRLWKAAKARRTVLRRNVLFDPTLTCDPESTINLFDGLALQPRECPADDVKVMLELLNHLCGNCAAGGEATVEQIAHWVLCWLALPLQQPGAKMRSALVFHGPEGTGKNLFFDVAKAVYGRYGIMVGQSELEEKYNGWLSAKLFIIGDEVVTRQEMYHNKNKLKWIITAERVPIRMMNQDPREEDNHANLVFLSNEQQPLVLEDTDRRYLVVYTPGVEDGDLYARVGAFLDAGGAAKWLHFLQNYDIGDFHKHSKPPMTAAKQELIELSMKPGQRFMSEWLNGFLALPMRVCSAEQLYRAFQRWCVQAGERYPPPRAQFTRAAERYVLERVERDETGARKPPRLTYKVVALKAPTGERKSARCWLPQGTGPKNGESEGEWANDSIKAFQKSLDKFCHGSFADSPAPPVTGDA
jgi:Family of unknown function (DUF5906)